MAEREVVFHGIHRIEPSKRNGNLLGRGPTGRPPARQTKIASNPMNVGVDGNHELRWRDGPQAEIDAVRGSDHPPRVKDQPLAGAAGARIADQVTGTAVACVSAKCVGETSEALAKISRLSVKRDERSTERPMLTEQSARAGQHAGQVCPAVDAVSEPSKPTTKLFGLCPAHQLRRIRAQRIDDATNASPSSDDVSEGEARRDESYDFLVLGPLVLVYEADGIVFAHLLPIAVSE